MRPAPQLSFILLFLTVLTLGLAPAAGQTSKRPAVAKKPVATARATGQPCPIPGLPEHSRRLVLKDGSYQAVSKCELVGDRVRYLSAERYEWEELPQSLVDWDATKKRAEQPETAPSTEVKQADAEEEAERKAEEAKSPEVAAGVRLPSQGGVFVLDYFRGQPELVEIVQNGGEINRNMSKNILRAAINPLAKNKQTIEVKGLHAPVQAHVPAPEIYVNIEPPEDATAQAKSDSDRFRLVRMQPKKDTRVVGSIEIAIYGKVSEKQNAIEVRSQPMGGGWTKITPATQLDPGEYALVEVLGKEINLYVWDFGVNPSAPENPTAWKPAAASKSANEKKPELQPRPKE